MKIVIMLIDIRYQEILAIWEILNEPAKWRKFNEMNIQVDQGMAFRAYWESRLVKYR